MCAIGRDQNTSIGAGVSAATLLGSAPTGGSTGSGARRITGGPSRSTYLGGSGSPGGSGGWTPGGPRQPGGPNQFIP